MIQTHSKAKQGGFTLVEIAIVLVIIGLLLGGILKGQELITSARVRNMADQNSSVQAAYYGFLDRYRVVPGDMAPGAVPNGACTLIGVASLPNCAGVGGNADGSLGSGGFPEVAAAWAHIAAAGFLNGTYTGTAANAAAYQNSGQAPQNVYGGYLLLARNTSYLTNAPPAAPRLTLTMGRQTPLSVAQQLDIKLDDGSANTGVLRSVVTAGTGFTPVDGDGAGGVCTAAGVWNIGADQQDCNVVYLY